MTQFPTLIDQVAAAVLAPAQAIENPHHRAILDTFVEIQELDRQLAELAEAELPAISPTEQLNTLTDLLVERMAAGAALSTLLSTSCCCAAAYSPEYEPRDDDEPDFGPDFEELHGFEDPTGLHDFDDFHDGACEEFLSCPSRPQTIVHACLAVFDDEGAPEYVSTAELVERLRDLPGQAEERWSYADLTPLRLGLLLRGYGVQPCKPRAADGSRYRAYRRADLLAARPNCSC
ncbi:hypothetical protein SLNWT_1306 [Streptomyces albus]|uniref:DUF3631 domain-containing protein n=1 Tax=Streptomyces albus (strain ATCC 21838 / DSM 41398 / FERM P-419 / JCM 4703 / NBRC 107858) TaxID=1081613 RepID=A0A0B5EU92_STRA4|nr:hypothetical protein SLNWT_1306 [Streptomyces albus]AOU75998.1 hypothetical protein SLNHY_1307 [Streptomyces albus]AYN31799.1 DUF3631 domain-containing protein [Streptomyces albus]